jgi:glucose/arabinose dehydrogenase
MSWNARVLLLFGLVVLIVACSESQPTTVYLPTNPPPSDTPMPSPTPPTATSVSESPTAATATSAQPSEPTAAVTPTPESAQAEPTQTIQPQPTEVAFPPVISLEPWLTGFENPVYLTHATKEPPWDSRLLVVEKVGRILLIEEGQVRPVPFLDIVGRVGSSSSEQGLLSVAFPRDFPTSGIFYVNYTDKRGDTVVSRFRLLEQDLAQGDPASEEKILEIAQPAGNHNGGQLQFGPDGYLYIGTGDGGRAGDPWRNAQNPGELLGKMLRLDVAGGDPYRIPGDNPFLGKSDVRSEIWALGLRNPWRFSFDRATGDLYIADVGQNAYEEVHVQPAHSTGGENYGWDIMEGNHCFEPARDCDSRGLTLPVVEYDHQPDCSITGGYVYRGERYPKMTGVYLFGDFCSGRIRGLRQMPSGKWEMASLLDSDVSISSFGEDAAGEIYIMGYSDGVIYRLIAAP